MYSNPKLNKRAFSFIMALCLVLNLIFIPGVFSATVFAEEAAEPTGTTQVLYVDGTNGSDENEGDSAAAALATLSAAYAKILSTNEKTTIVICGNVVVSKGSANPNGTEGVTWSGYAWWIAPHAGEVVFTSKYGEEDYTGTASFQIDRTWHLLGNTSFENICIKHAESSEIYAHYYDLCLGENVKYPTSGYADYRVFVQTIYLGSNTTMHNKFNIRTQNVTFTMESGAVTTLNGGGNGRQGYYNEPECIGDKYVPHSVTINVKGGTVENLTVATSGGVYNDKNYTTPISDANINICGGKVNNLVEKSGLGVIDGTLTCVIDLKGENVSMNVDTGVELSVIDTTNKSKDGTGAGTFTNTGSGTVKTVSQDPNTLMRYLKHDNGNGTYSFHPFNLTVYEYGINTKREDGPVVALSSVFMANNVVRDEHIAEYGIYVNDGQNEEYCRVDTNYSLENNFVYAYADLLNSLSEGKIDTTKTVKAYVKFNDGTVEYSTTEGTVNPRAIFEGIYEKVTNGEIAVSEEQRTIIETQKAIIDAYGVSE